MSPSRIAKIVAIAGWIRKRNPNELAAGARYQVDPHARSDFFHAGPALIALAIVAACSPRLSGCQPKI
jgi:hypothetical protein